MDNILGLFEKLESQSLAVQPSRCVVVRNRNASCRRCAEACPTGAILVEGNDLAVAPERCIGCGTCATVCPTAALESKKPDDKGLLKAAVAAMQANDGVAVVMDEAMQAAAEGKYDPAKVVAVKSLARVDESLIAVLAAGGRELRRARGGAAGRNRRRRGRRGRCRPRGRRFAGHGSRRRGRRGGRRCRPHGPARARHGRPAAGDLGQRRHGEAYHQAAPFRAPYRAGRFRHGAPRLLLVDARRGPGRRSHHRRARGAREAGRRGSRKSRSSRKWARTARCPTSCPSVAAGCCLALSNMGEPGRRHDRHAACSATSSSIREKCTSCQMCATFCPTEAIHKFGDAATAAETGKPFGIDHYTGRCVQCRCCEDICPTGALTLSDRRVRRRRHQARPLRAHPHEAPRPQGERPQVHRERHE